jgi:hypothetical protein
VRTLYFWLRTTLAGNLLFLSVPLSGIVRGLLEGFLERPSEGRETPLPGCEGRGDCEEGCEGQLRR